MNALVTGGSGFVGQWLIRSLLKNGDRVTALSIGQSGPPILETTERDRVLWIEGDITDAAKIDRALREASPDHIYHLAGVSFIPAAQASPEAAYETNTLGMIRLIGAVIRYHEAGHNSPRVLVVGSGEQYGQHPPDNGPLKESASQKPVSVYAAGKAAQEVIAIQAFSGFSIPVVATRSFNHSGYGQDSRFLLPGLVARLRKLSQTGENRLAVGNTSPIRDFLHVRDVVKAYMSLMLKGRPGEVYNVSSGEGISVSDLIKRALMVTDTSAIPVSEPSLKRATDIPWLVGSSEKLTRDTGWKREHGVDDIIRDLWRGAPQVVEEATGSKSRVSDAVVES